MSNPTAGVRFELTRVTVEGTTAAYDATVSTPEGTGTARLVIEPTTARVEGTPDGITDAHVTQLLAIARTLGRRADEGWPRRINRWRAPGVR